MWNNIVFFPQRRVILTGAGRYVRVFASRWLPCRQGSQTDIYRGYTMELTQTPDTTHSATSPFAALMAMFYEPTKAFGMLETKRHSWFPLVLLMASSCVLMLWYFNVVDFAWMLDTMTASIKDPAAREQASAMMSKSTMQTMGIAGSLVVLPLFMALYAVYFLLVAKAMNNDSFGFGAGFGLAAWSSVPSLLMLPLGAMQIMLSSNYQLTTSELNPLTLNQLLFQYPMMHPLSGPLDMLSVPFFWSILLMIIGFQVFAKVSRATAAKVVLIPHVTVFGLWIAYALSASPAA